ncbi:YveK family protein [Ligilactobacillus saerimneri]
MNTNEYNEVDLLNLIKALLHRWWVIIAGTIVCAAIGYVWSAWVVTPTYVSTTKIYITGKQTTRNGSYNGSTTQMLNDYEALITSRTVLEKVIKTENLQMSYSQLLKQITVENANNTQIIAISVANSSPRLAQRLAAATEQGARSHGQKVLRNISVKTIDYANYPYRPTAPNIKLYVVYGAGAGLLLSTIILLLLYLWDDKIRTEQDIERYLGLRILAVIPKP